MGRQRGVTLKQIAERAGCSVTAVSKTLNGARGTAAVSAETQKRVLALADEMGYTPNYLARALQSGRTNAVGLASQASAAGTHSYEYWNRIFGGVESHLREAGQDLVVVGAQRGQAKLQRAISHLLEKRLDALLVPAAVYPVAMETLEQVEAPVVYVGPAAAGAAHPTVDIDPAPGIAAALAHLKELGHDEVLWVPTRCEGELSDPLRHRAMMVAARDAGLDISEFSVEMGPLDDMSDTAAVIDSCRQQFQALLRHGRPASAAITYSERIGIGLYAALAEAGLRVPHDVSVIGFDNLYAQYAVPTMTTVSLSLTAVGERAAELALELASGTLSAEDARGRVELVPSKLLIGRSTAPAT